MTPHALYHYTQLTEFLGRVLGPDYEILFHDLSREGHSLVAISNNKLSGRCVGGGLTEAEARLLEDQSCRKADYRLSYREITPDGHTLSCAALFIKDETGCPEAMLCIRFNDRRYQALAQQLLALCAPDPFVETTFAFDENLLVPTDPEPEYLPPAAETTAGQAVAQLLREKNLSPRRLTLDERMDIITQLDGAVKDAAEALCCSPASVYRYLSNLHHDE